MGRPASSRGVYALSAGLALPDVAAVDSSFVVSALVSAEPDHAECRAFLKAWAEQGAALVVSPLLRYEVAESAFKIAVTERHGSSRGLSSARADGRIRRRAGRLMDETIEAWQETLEGFDWAEVSLGEVADDSMQLMRRYGLQSYDAAHAATAFYLGVNDIITLDSDFARLPQTRMHIFTVSRFVPAMRRRRRQQARRR